MKNLISLYNDLSLKKRTFLVLFCTNLLLSILFVPLGEDFFNLFILLIFLFDTGVLLYFNNKESREKLRKNEVKRINSILIEDKRTLFNKSLNSLKSSEKETLMNLFKNKFLLYKNINNSTEESNIKDFNLFKTKREKKELEEIYIKFISNEKLNNDEIDFLLGDKND